MNEIQLSDSLPVIETEIRQFQNLAGESIFEIGRRLKHVKENDLAHGEFRKWHENLGINKDFASQSIKVSEELSTNVETFRHLGTTALKIITQLPETERTKEHVTEKGETKTPDEMTVRELSELKKRLKNQSETIDETTSQLKAREKENDLLQSKLEEMENREPEVIERYSEPDDYREIKKQLEKSETEREELRSQLQKWHLTDKERQEKSDKYDQLNEAINSLDMKLSENQQRMKNRKFINDLIIQSRILMREVAPLTYTIESLHDDDLEQLHNPLNEVANELYKISKDIKNKINSGVIVNE